MSLSIIKKVNPSEIYNLGAQSHMVLIHKYTANVDALGTLRILEAIRMLNLKKKRFYQASCQSYTRLTQENIKMKTLHFIQDHLMHSKLFAFGYCKLQKTYDLLL